MHRLWLIANKLLAISFQNFAISYNQKIDLKTLGNDILTVKVIFNQRAYAK